MVCGRHCIEPHKLQLQQQWYRCIRSGTGMRKCGTLHPEHRQHRWHTGSESTDQAVWNSPVRSTAEDRRNDIRQPRQCTCRARTGLERSRLRLSHNCNLQRKTHQNIRVIFSPHAHGYVEWVCCVHRSCSRLLGGVVVRALDLWSRDRRFDSRPVHCRVA